MERKTTQRIIGVLVMVALVIILLPLILDKNEAATQTAAIKPPPFPDQASVAQADTKKAAETIVITPEIADKINQSSQTTPIRMTATETQIGPATTEKPSSESSKQPEQVVAAQSPTQPALPKPDALSTTAQSSATILASSKPITPATPVSEEIKSESPTAMQSSAPVVKSDSIVKEQPKEPHFITASEEQPVKQQEVKQPQHAKIKLTKTKSIQAKHIQSHVVKTASAKHTVDSISLAKNKLAWAVQLGSFKNKDNAIRLADRLRSAGYKAFMHEVKSPKGNVQTRVYIGPEYKQASATKLSMQLAQKMNVHGYIVPYKPLEL